MAGPLAGFTVGITGDRRADEQAELLSRRGAHVLHGPTIETRPFADDPALRRACEELMARPPQVLVATTGVGMRSWLESADDMGAGEPLRLALAGAEVLARSPKAAGALVTLGLGVHWQAAGERSADVLAHLAQRDLRDVRIAVQRDGSNDPSLARALASTGADVVDVPAYRWHVPSETAPAHRLLGALADRQLDAITVTSSPALSNLLALTEDREDADAVRAGLTDPDVIVACVGPVCRERALQAGIANIVQPGRFRLGSMVKSLADALGARAWRLQVTGVDVVVQGGLVVVDGHEVRVPRREAQLLGRLAAGAGTVVAKAELGRAVWGAGTDQHVVEVAVGRLRRRLGRAGALVVTVPRRGYRLVAPPQRAGPGA